MREPTFEELEKYYNFRCAENEFLEIKKIALVFYPEAVSFSAEFFSEYNDEGGYYLAISSTGFYDSDGNKIAEDGEKPFTREQWPEILEKMKKLGMETESKYRKAEYTYDTYYFDIYDLVSTVFNNSDSERDSVEFDLTKPFNQAKPFKLLIQ